MNRIGSYSFTFAFIFECFEFLCELVHIILMCVCVWLSILCFKAIVPKLIDGLCSTDDDVDDEGIDCARD